MAKSANSLANLKPLEKGTATGRPVGSANKTTTLMKKALVLAAGRSKHVAKEQVRDLTAYLTFLSDDYPPVFAMLLARLIPEQSKPSRDDSNERHTIINLNMPVSQMVNVFEQRVRSSYMPKPVLVIDNDDDSKPDA